MMMYYGGGNAGWAIACMVAVIAIISLVAWAFIVATTRGDTRPGRDGATDATTVLEQRFASGDIDEDEYRVDWRKGKYCTLRSLDRDGASRGA